jgi:hypothetical protein
MANQNPQIGVNTELLFKNSIGKNLVALAAIKAHFGIRGNFARAYKTGSDAGKSDVIVAFDDQNRKSANVKAFAAGFNQLTRTTIPSFCTQFGLQLLQETLEQGAVRKAGKTGKFIEDADNETVRQAFEPLAQRIVHYALANLENPELLVLYDRKANKMNLYDMAEVLDSLDYTVTITPRGTVKIGDYITVQRKGGNGVKYNHIAKTDLSHPGNNLQVKMKVREFVRDVAPIVSYAP